MEVVIPFMLPAAVGLVLMTFRAKRYVVDAFGLQNVRFCFGLSDLRRSMLVPCVLMWLPAVGPCCG
jgi:hypothetical protein